MKVIQTEYKYWDGLIEQIEHHAPKMNVFVVPFMFGILEILGPLDEVWTLRQSKTGARSWALIAPSGTEYHLRSDDYETPQIDVYDRWSYQSDPHAILLATLTSPAEVRPWLQALVRAHQMPTAA
jgi:hypothetical protein